MKVSIALCSCDGERYLPEQLQSFVEQRRRPDELIVVDDRSRDATVPLLQAFAASSPFPVRIVVNDERLGVTANFEKALALCSGDVVLPSDQDDVWRPEKLEVLTGVLAARPDLLVVTSNADLIDGDGRALALDFWTALQFSRDELAQFDQGRSFEALVNKNLAAGMVMALRRELLATALPIPRCWIHDGWIALLAAADDRFAIIPDRLVRYRLHGRNAVGISHLAWRQRLARALTVREDSLREQLAQTRAALERLPSATPRERRAFLEQRIVHHEARLGLPRARWRRLPLLARELRAGRYERYSSGWLTAAKDLVRRT